jgi:methyl-accepting chemotaxis protein
MADLSVTIGLDQTELEKGLAGAGKKLGGLAGSVNAGKNPFDAAAGQLSSGMGIGSLLGGPVGGVIGAFFDAFGAMIGSLMSKIKEVAEYAQKIRRISLTTGLDVGQVRQLESIGMAFGVSLESMSRSVVEFTRRMGEARIKGGEVTNILAKMGVGMDEVANGTFNHQKAMQMLADSYAAGTDEATLLYYGTKMFGDSFKELLPIIKAGSKAIEDAADSYHTANEGAVGALGRGKQDMEKWGQAWDNFWINLIGSVFEMIEELEFSVANFFSPGAWNPFESLEDEIKRKIDNAPKYMTDEEIKKFVLDEVDDDKKEEAKKELEKQLKGSGKVLTPFGMSEAGAASQMQQMGGGDIFGAVAFSPLERIATATEETAQNTKPGANPTPRTPDELSR